MKIVAIYEIIAGIVGLATYLITAKLSLVLLLVLAPLPIAAVLSLIGGYRLLRDLRGGRAISVIAQVLQLPVLATPYLTYQLGLGFFLAVAAGMSSSATGVAHLATTYAFQLGATIKLNIDSAPQAVAQSLFGINLVALVLLIVLLSAKRRPAV